MFFIQIYSVWCHKVMTSLGFGGSHMEGRFLEEIHLFPLLLFGCIWCQYLNNLTWRQGIFTPCGSQWQEGDSSTFTAPSEESVNDCPFKQTSRINCGHERLISCSHATAGLTVKLILCKCIQINLSGIQKLYLLACLLGTVGQPRSSEGDWP